VSAAAISPRRARAIVEARLGRTPQDMLEAAVVLEAWGGVPAHEALDLAGAVMRVQARDPEPSTATMPEPAERDRPASEAIAFVAAVLAIALWAAPLAAELSSAVVETAVRFALPLTLALQWGLRSRYLGRPDGVALLARHRRALALATVVLVTVPALAAGPAGALAGLLTLTWTAGTVLVHRGWAVLYAAIVLLATVTMLTIPDAAPALTAVAALTVAGVAVALRLPATDAGLAPGAWGRAATAATLGGTIGALIVSDVSIPWVAATSPALVLLPSTLAGVWGAQRLWGFDRSVAASLAGVPALAAGGRRTPGWGPLRVLLGAVSRVVIGTAVLSAAFAIAAPSLGAAGVDGVVLVAFGLLTMATLLVSFLEAVGRTRPALAALLTALAAEHVAMAGSGVGTAVPLLVGASAVVLIALPGAVALLLRPADMLATTLYVR
jgi:hypothetical protein